MAQPLWEIAWNFPIKLNSIEAEMQAMMLFKSLPLKTYVPTKPCFKVWQLSILTTASPGELWYMSEGTMQSTQ